MLTKIRKKKAGDPSPETTLGGSKAAADLSEKAKGLLGDIDAAIEQADAVAARKERERQQNETYNQRREKNKRNCPCGICC